MFTGNLSLDGYINDVNGDFDWGEPSDEVHQFFNDLERAVGTHLYGRRLYETMKVWETMPPTSPVMDDYASVWRDSDKVVFSRTLQDVASSRTTLHREFSPEFVADLKLASSQDITIGGPTLAARAIDLVDDFHAVLYPVTVGGGTRFWPEGASGRFALADSRVFGSGVVHLHYRRES